MLGLLSLSLSSYRYYKVVEKTNNNPHNVLQPPFWVEFVEIYINQTPLRVKKTSPNCSISITFSIAMTTKRNCCKNSYENQNKERIVYLFNF